MNYRKPFEEFYKSNQILSDEIKQKIDFAIEILTGYSYKDFILGKELTDAQIQKVKEVLKLHISTGEPLQYILGKSFFCNRIYFVNSNTLIPRPETEILVDVCKKSFDKNRKLKILDIGTGSGCIAVELALFFENSQITAVDICQGTLDVALKNAEFHSVSARIQFLKSDLFERVQGKYDIIVSNPPYIAFADVSEVQKDVYEFEPHSALFANDNGLFFYKKIIKSLNTYLNTNSFVAFEVGYTQAEIVASLLENDRFVNVSLTKDFDNVFRVVTANH